MSKNTKIQWCDDTVNPTLGCDGCELWNHQNKICYAGSLTRRFGGSNPGFATVFEQVETAAGRMAAAAKWSDLRGTSRPNKPWLKKLPRLIFVSDMADALSKGIRLAYLHEEIIKNVTSDAGRRHQWLWLTKRPARMAKFSAWLERRDVQWPSNLWAGTSITTRKSTSRIKQLVNVGDDDTIRFLSVEPQWEQIDLRPWLPHLSWVIQGGQSGRGAKSFDIEWAMDLLEQCCDFDVPYFLKQLGSTVLWRDRMLELVDGHGGDWAEWPKKVRVRQLPVMSVSRNAASLEQQS